MVDVIARAAVEIIPDVDMFARLMKTKLTAMSGDIEKSLAGVDKKLSTLGQGSGGSAFGGIAADAKREFESVNQVVEKTNNLITKSTKETQRGVSLGWVATADGMREIFASTSKSIDKSNKDVERSIKKVSTTATKANAETTKSTTDVDNSFLSLINRLRSVSGRRRDRRDGPREAR